MATKTIRVILQQPGEPERAVVVELEDDRLPALAVMQKFGLSTLELASADAEPVLLGYRPHDGLSHKRFLDVSEVRVCGAVTAWPAAAGAAAGPAAGVAGAGADRTSDFLRACLPLDKLPKLGELSDVFKAGIVVGGARLKLPVPDFTYASLAAQSTEWDNWLQPNSQCRADRLSVLVAMALQHPTPQPDQELVMPALLDGLTFDVIELAGQALHGIPVVRQRNSTDASVTLQKLRPDFLLLVSNALLFKGEEKPTAKELGVAIMELLDKMSTWSAYYHGTVEYMLCYAAGGTMVELGVIPRPGAEAEQRFVKLLQLNVADPFHRLQLIHAFLLTYCIIQQQARQLPVASMPLGLTQKRDHGTSIILLADRVLKRVDLDQHPWLQCSVGNMEAVYAAAKGCLNIIQAVDPPKAHKGKYSVYLRPVGTPVPAAFPCSEAELQAAARCILQALNALHSKGWGHGDVRWANVIMVTSELFVVIDLESALPLGEAPHLAGHPHPKAWGPEQEALDDGVFTAASDLYMVGTMLQDKASCCAANSSVHGLCQRLLRKDISLEAALSHSWLAVC